MTDPNPFRWREMRMIIAVKRVHSRRDEASFAAALRVPPSHRKVPRLRGAAVKNMGEKGCWEELPAKHDCTTRTSC